MRKKIPEKLNICLVSKKFPLFGTSSDQGTIWPIAKGLAQKGHRVTVLTTDTRSQIQNNMLDMVRFVYFQPQTHGSGYDLNLVDVFSKLHMETPFHLVHSLDTLGYSLALQRKKLKFSICFDVSATQLSQLYIILGMSQETLSSFFKTSVALAYKFIRTYFGFDRALLKNSDGIFVMSPHERTVLERYYLYPDAKIFNVPYGVDVGEPIAIEEREKLRQKLNISIESKIVVTVTDMTEVGPMINLLEAFERVAVKNSKAKLIVVGNGPRFHEIEGEALSLALGSRVLFAGAVAAVEMPKYISLGDIFINISSRTTGFEPSLLEAMMQKKVIVGSEVSPISTIVEDGVDGFLVRPADIKSISRLISDIFLDRIPIREIGENARKKVTSLFNVEKMVEQTLTAYQSILKQTRRFTK